MNMSDSKEWKMAFRLKLIAGIFTAGLVSSGSVLADNPGPDILGVTLGAKFSDTVALIKATNANFKEELETTAQYGHLQGKEFDIHETLRDPTHTTWGPKETVDLGIGGVGDGEYVTLIGRDVAFDDNDPARPTVADTVKALTAKYGSSLTRRGTNSNETTGSYVYDLSGKLLGPGARGCADIVNPTANFDDSGFAGECGLSVAWWVEPALDNPGLVRELRVFIKNPQIFFRSLNERKAAVAAEQKAQLQSAKGVAAPKL
jgi:hypothetical protein